MSAEVSFTKRAAQELSRCFNGITVRQNRSKAQSTAANNADNTSQQPINGNQKPLINESTQLIGKTQLTNYVNNRSNNSCHNLNLSPKFNHKVTPNGTPRRGSRNGLLPPQAPPKTWRARRKNYLLNVQRAKYIDELWSDNKFLMKFFTYFSPIERCLLAQVCKTWQTLLYSDHRFWRHLMPVLFCDELRREKSLTSAASDQQIVVNTCGPQLGLPNGADFVINEIKANLYYSIDVRSFDSIGMFGATDGDIVDFTSKTRPTLLNRLTTVSLRNSSISDKGLEVLLSSLSSLLKLELTGCNEITDSVMWTALVPKLEILVIMDCINISDETVAAICQMLPNLKKLQIQAYHVTDTSMAYFGSTMARENLRVLMLHHCWELSNQGVATLAHGLPNLHTLSLSGCSKVSDDAIEVIAEQIRGLRYLDLSWCPRVSDASLEYIACDLSDTLTHLILDRCLHITCIGMGYVATMTRLYHLSLRWCPQVRDFGLQTLCSMRSLKSLSLAGCPQLTITGLSCLVQMQTLSDLELTNCPAATPELINYLSDNLPHNCMITI
ncbi:F-box/LRR-repeat protein 16-like [Oppia nitens]|uniref:F-box/LRR-repeat protein 16-like n=1 Tax=Oppia nitens TaxID=1686743 RepID=UPI0023DA0610|nr:F-box/LRR-repeat protein 16-like [Oppia nitens]